MMGNPRVALATVGIPVIGEIMGGQLVTSAEVIRAQASEAKIAV